MDRRKLPESPVFLNSLSVFSSLPGSRGLILYVRENLEWADPEGIAGLEACLQDAGFKVWQLDASRYPGGDLRFDDACRLILFDIRGPNDICFRLCARLRARWTGPIFALLRESAYLEAVRAIKAGCDMYLFVPYDNAELVARVNALLRRSERGRN